MMTRVVFVWAFAVGIHSAPADEYECCGRHALRAAADFLGSAPPAGGWDELLPPAQAPFSLADLDRAAQAVGLDALAVQWPDPRAADLSGVCVLHVRRSASSPEPDHFVTCFGRDRSAVLVADYPGLPQWVPIDRLEQHWQGVALHLGRPEDGSVERLRRTAYWSVARWWAGVGLLGVAGLLAVRAAARRFVRPRTAP